MEKEKGVNEDASVDAQKEEEEKIKQIEEGNKRLEEALKKREELMARERLSGKSEAGKPLKTPEELDKEKIEFEADRIFRTLKKRK